MVTSKNKPGNKETPGINMLPNRQLEEALEYAENIVSTVREPLLVLDADLRIISASRSFYQVFLTAPEETRGKLIYEVGNGQWDIPQLRELLEKILPNKSNFDNFEVDHEFPDLGRRIMLLNARRIRNGDAKKQTILLAIEDITERKHAEDELKRRTLELEVTNNELQAFAYSVSHDLRAPLRSMGGFSSALLEDYSEKLDEDGKRYLRHIQESSNVMGQLIDDLLKLSRAIRSEMNREKVNLSEMALKVIDDLEKAEPDHMVKVVIASDITAYGDRNLLNIVLVNLLGNAWKFSSKVAEPRMEMGITERNGKPAYFVRDNGAGFDMKYTDKLFKPFQRLHKAEEFAGTGIGLATVQRIILRHGGEVWAESETDKGATFYFTLG